ERSVSVLDNLQSKVIRVSAFCFALMTVLRNTHDVVASPAVTWKANNCGHAARPTFRQQQITEHREIVPALKDDLFPSVVFKCLFLEACCRQVDAFGRKAADKLEQFASHAFLPLSRTAFSCRGETHRRLDALITRPAELKAVELPVVQIEVAQRTGVM